VIGGGAVGLACAYYASRSGARVAVFDQAAVGMGSSYGNVGQLSPSNCVPLATPGVVIQGLKWLVRRDAPLHVRARVSLDELTWLGRFAWSSRLVSLEPRIRALRDLGALSLGLIEGFAEGERSKFAYRRAGVMNVYSSGRGWRVGLAEAAALREHGIAGEVLSPDGAREREPLLTSDVRGGVFYPSDAHCDPYSYVRVLADKVTSVGGSIHEHVGVSGFESDHGAVAAVKTTDGSRVICDQLVIAAGAQSGYLAKKLGYAIPIVAGRGYSADFDAAIAPRVPLLLHEQHVAVTPEVGFVRAGGRLEFGRANERARKRGAMAVVEAARTSLPAASDWSVQRMWAGARPCSADGVPVIGRLPNQQNVIVASGHTMLGITQSAGTGKVVSSLLSGTNPPIPIAGFRADRFRAWGR
jgi:D-amino-acid dehydrogenase